MSGDNPDRALSVCPNCNREHVVPVGQIMRYCPFCFNSYSVMNVGTYCTLAETPCRHCSEEKVKEVDRPIDNNKVVRTERTYILGLYCNNECAWVSDMKQCPVPEHIRGYLKRVKM